jgi:membrane protein YdbS with pleckstrin-like domain
MNAQGIIFAFVLVILFFLISEFFYRLTLYQIAADHIESPEPNTLADSDE